MRHRLCQMKKKFQNKKISNPELHTELLVVQLVGCAGRHSGFAVFRKFNR